MSAEELKLVLSPLIQAVIQTWPLCGALTIFGQWIWAWQWVRTKPQLPGCCLLRAGPPGRAGLADVPIAPACSVWIWRGGEKFHRSASGQENLSASCWRQQRCSSHLYRPGAGCLRVPTASVLASSCWWKSLQILTEKYGFIQSKEGRFDVSFRI